MSAPDQEPRLAGKLKRAFNEREVTSIWHGLEAQRARPRASVWFSRLGLGLGALALAAVILLWGVKRDQDAPLALKGAHTLPLLLQSPKQAALYQLDDGSKIALAHGAGMEVVRNDGSELTAVLRKGKVTFRVQPGGRRRWSIETGLLSVQVIGTQFVVDRKEASVSVQVQHGVVLVRSAQLPDGLRRLTAGQSVLVSREPASATPLPLSPHTRLQPIPTVASSAQSDAPTRPAQKVGLEPEQGRSASLASTSEHDEPWWKLAERGEYRASRARIEADGGMTGVTGRTQDPQKLLLLADVARQVSEPEAALSALERLLARAPHSAEATVGAFMLGKLELEVLSRPREAVAHFSRVVADGSNTALAEDALARLVDAYLRSGEPALARLRASEYLTRYPQGRHVERMRQEAEPSP